MACTQKSKKIKAQIDKTHAAAGYFRKANPALKGKMECRVSRMPDTPGVEKVCSKAGRIDGAELHKAVQVVVIVGVLVALAGQR